MWRTQINTVQKDTTKDHSLRSRPVNAVLSRGSATSPTRGCIKVCHRSLFFASLRTGSRIVKCAVSLALSRVGAFVVLSGCIILQRALNASLAFAAFSKRSGSNRAMCALQSSLSMPARTLFAAISYLSMKYLCTCFSMPGRSPLEKKSCRSSLFARVLSLLTSFFRSATFFSRCAISSCLSSMKWYMSFRRLSQSSYCNTAHFTSIRQIHDSTISAVIVLFDWSLFRTVATGPTIKIREYEKCSASLFRGDRIDGDASDQNIRQFLVNLFWGSRKSRIGVKTIKIRSFLRPQGSFWYHD